MAILAGIEQHEGKPLDEVDKETLEKYAVEIGDAGDILSDRLPSAHRERIKA